MEKPVSIIDHKLPPPDTAKQKEWTALSVTIPIGVMVVDSGCVPVHLVNSTEGLVNFRPAVEPQSVGQAELKSPRLSITGYGYMKPWGRMTVCPQLRYNLLSTAQFDSDGWSTTFSNGLVDIRDAKGEAVASGYKVQKGLFVIDKIHSWNPETNKGTANLVTQNNGKLLVEHHKWGHLSLGGLRTVHEMGLIPQITKEELKQGYGFCPSCAGGKATKRGRNKQQRGIQTTRKGELTHTDIAGPMVIATVNGARYFIVFVDDFTRMPKVYLLKSKSEALKAWVRYIKELLLPEGIQPDILRSDNGGEFTSAEFDSFCKGIGTKRQLTAPNSSFQNGVAERAIRTIMERGLTQLLHSGMGKEWWGPSFLYAAFVQARCPTKALSGPVCIPYTKWTGRRVDTNDLIPWGVTGHVYIPSQMRSKLDSRSTKGIFLGCQDTRKGYEMWIPSKQQIIWSRDVTFEMDSAASRSILEGAKTERIVIHQNNGLQSKKNQFLSAKVKKNNEEIYANENTTQVEGSAASQPMSTKVKTPSEIDKLKVDQLRVELRLRNLNTGGLKQALRQRLREHMLNESDQKTNQHASTEINKTEENGQNTNQQTSAEINKSKDDMENFTQVSGPNSTTNLCVLLSEATATMAREINEPTTYQQAITCKEKKKWNIAIMNELNSLKSNEVYKIVPKPTNANILGTKWVFKVKALSDGSIARYKARLTAKGYGQQYLVDYFDTYAPVARITSVRVLLALAVSRRWKIHQMDVDTAFLNAELNEEVYVYPPEGTNTSSGKVWKLKRALYGLKQAPKAWNENVTAYLISQGFTQLEEEVCIFVKRQQRSGKIECIVGVYVDDVLIAANNDQQIMACKELFSGKYKMKDQGLLEWYCGIKVTQSDGLITLSQQLNILTLLEKYGMKNCAPAKTPMRESDLPALNDGPQKGSEEAIKMEEVPYRNLVGALLYIAQLTRPDIAVAVNKLSRYVANPGLKHWVCVKRILRYLKKTAHYALHLREGDTTLTAYADASWGDADQDRHSQSGHLFYVGKSLISWNTYRQRVVARSTAEAEYVSLSDATQEIVWLRRLLSSLDAHQGTTTLYEDSQSAISMTDNVHKTHKRTKHIDIRYRYVCDELLRGTLTLSYIPTTDMIADALTKPLPAAQFQKFRNLMGIEAEEC